MTSLPPKVCGHCGATHATARLFDIRNCLCYHANHYICVDCCLKCFWLAFCKVPAANATPKGERKL